MMSSVWFLSSLPIIFSNRNNYLIIKRGSGSAIVAVKVNYQVSFSSLTPQSMFISKTTIVSRTWPCFVINILPNTCFAYEHWVIQSSFAYCAGQGFFVQRMDTKRKILPRKSTLTRTFKQELLTRPWKNAVFYFFDWN